MFVSPIIFIRHGTRGIGWSGSEKQFLSTQLPYGQWLRADQTLVGSVMCVKQRVEDQDYSLSLSLSSEQIWKQQIRVLDNGWPNDNLYIYAFCNSVLSMGGENH